ncbi:hypothetical protein Sm713_18390 [Streptomyces sp. TS71-3]|nr:hypothetical protein Sm713_18390 [Streptomyces sp. TS71-3]
MRAAGSAATPWYAVSPATAATAVATASALLIRERALVLRMGDLRSIQGFQWSGGNRRAARSLGVRSMLGRHAWTMTLHTCTITLRFPRAQRSTTTPLPGQVQVRAAPRRPLGARGCVDMRLRRVGATSHDWGHLPRPSGSGGRQVVTAARGQSLSSPDHRPVVGWSRSSPRPFSGRCGPQGPPGGHPSRQGTPAGRRRAELDRIVRRLSHPGAVMWLTAPVSSFAMIIGSRRAGPQ